MASIDLRNPSLEIKTSLFKTGRNLSNNIFQSIDKVLPFSNWKEIERLAVATGPGSFTSTRISIALCRTIAQQINCKVDGLSSFYLMAKRLHAQNKLIHPEQPFWIISSLKRRGLIGGLYQIEKDSNIPYCEQIIEINPPHLIKQEVKMDQKIQANEDVYSDTLELIKISLSAYNLGRSGSWEEIKPIYPTSPVDNA